MPPVGVPPVIVPVVDGDVVEGVITPLAKRRLPEVDGASCWVSTVIAPNAAADVTYDEFTIVGLFPTDAAWI